MEASDIRKLSRSIISDKDDDEEEDSESREVESLRIEKLDNGYIVDVHFKPPKPKKGKDSCCMPYEGPKRKVFTDVAEIGAFVKEVFG